MGRPLSLKIENLLEFVTICGYFMVAKPFVYSQFCVLFPVENFESFRENVFCNVLFGLKISGYLCLARDLMAFASDCFEHVFCFDDLAAAHSAIQFFYMVNQRFLEIENGGMAQVNFLKLVFVLLNFCSGAPRAPVGRARAEPHG